MLFLLHVQQSPQSWSLQRTKSDQQNHEDVDPQKRKTCPWLLPIGVYVVTHTSHHGALCCQQDSISQRRIRASHWEVDSWSRTCWKSAFKGACFSDQQVQGWVRGFHKQVRQFQQGKYLDYGQWWKHTGVLLAPKIFSWLHRCAG